MKKCSYTFLLGILLFVACTKTKVLTSPLMNLERENTPTLYHIDYVNGQLVDESTKGITISGEFLEIQGWAVDVKGSDVPANIVFQVGEKQFENTLITKRQDVANALNMKKAVNSGYSFKVPTEKLGKGVFETKLIVIDKDNDSYYVPDPAKTIQVHIE